MKEKICQFKIVKVNIPQKLLIKLFYCKRHLTPKESLKISQKSAQVEEKINQLLHIKSIVEKIQLKSDYK